MKRFVLWFVPAGLGLATALVFAGGFAAGISGTLGRPVSDELLPKATPAPAAPATGAFRIVAIGDSMTRGAGDVSGGYPERVARTLRAKGWTVVVDNLGIDGAETKDLLRKVNEPDARRRLAGAQLILMSISGNDLSHSLPSLSTAGASPDTDPTAPALRAAAGNLRSILSAVREANASAPIRLLGVYNPFGEGAGERRLARQALALWNLSLEQASFTVEGALVVPVADLFEGRPDRLAADRFHPGPAGYDEIAARVVSTLNAGGNASSSGRQ